MNKIKMKYGFILFLSLIVGFNTSLSAKGNNLNLFLELSTTGLGGGVELKLYNNVSLRSSLDMPGFEGGLFFNIDGVYTTYTSKIVKPFFTIGYFDYYFKGNSRYDNDAIKSFTFGLGIKFYTKKNKASAAAGVKIATAEDASFPIIYCDFIFQGFK